jgi:hypothetical protein
VSRLVSGSFGRKAGRFSMTAVRWLMLAVVLGVLAPCPATRGDNKPAPKKEPTLADDEARLVGEWKKAFTVDKVEWTHTLVFKKDGSGSLRVSSPKLTGADTFTWQAIELRGGHRFIAFTNSHAFTEDGILVPHKHDRGRLLLLGGKTRLGVILKSDQADLKGPWERVEAKDK